MLTGVRAGGFLGSHVVRALMAEGRPVRVFLRRTANSEGISGLPVEWIYGDVNDADAVSAAGPGLRTASSIAWVNTQALGPRYGADVPGLSSMWLVTVMEAALAHGVKRFVKHVHHRHDRPRSGPASRPRLTHSTRQAGRRLSAQPGGR